MAIDPQDLGNFFKRHNWRFGKCLEPTLLCQQKAIRAHSIQNARVIDLIATNGHVISPRFKIIDGMPQIEFKLVGRNEASTFTGFCSEHDAKLFKPLDATALNTRDPEQLFLLSYRSVTRELHAVMEGAYKIQSAYQSRVERGLDPANEASPAGLIATEHLIKSYETYRYRAEHFDETLTSRQFNEIGHDVVVLKDQSPCIAVSSLFSLDELWNGDDIVRVVLNVVPMDASHTVAVFSYTRDDRSKARAALDRILTSQGPHQKYELSKLILEQIEHFLISPIHFDSWGAGKVATIKTAFAETILNKKSSSENPDLMLF